MDSFSKRRLGHHAGVEIGFDSVRKLAKLEACVKEVLRLHPPIPLFPRKVSERPV